MSEVRAGVLADSPVVASGPVQAAPDGADAALPATRTGWVVAGLLIVPLVVVAVAQTRSRWFPIMDQAMIELLVRDVGGPHNPTTGLVGRLSAGGHAGFHPGPLSWYLLAPSYRLLGSTANALVVANVVVEIAAVGCLVWLTARSRRPLVVVGVGLMTAVLMRAFGAVLLAKVWNIHLPLLWWLVVLVAAWRVLDGDRVALPVLLGAATLCTQTHVSYAVPVGAVSALAVGSVAWDAWRADPHARRRAMRGLAASLGGMLLLWLPVLWQELRADPGNLTTLVRYFSDPPARPIGFRPAYEVLAAHLNPVRLISGDLWGNEQRPDTLVADEFGTITPGTLLLVVWVATIALSWRRATASARRAHLVVAVALVASLVATSRVVPPTWYWVVMFLWVVQVAVVLSSAAALVDLARTRWRVNQPAVRLGAAGALAVVGVVFAFETISGPRLNETARASLQLAELTRAAVPALRTDPTLPGGSTLLVLMRDTAGINSAGYGLVNELERAGFAVVTNDVHAAEVRTHRTLSAAGGASIPRDVVLASGAEIDAALRAAGAVEIARVDLRTAGQRARHEAARGELIELLRAAGRDDLASSVDTNLPAVLFAELDPGAASLARELADLGVAVAIVAAPHGAG